jgi:hypothetical protein
MPGRFYIWSGKASLALSLTHALDAFQRVVQSASPDPRQHTGRCLSWCCGLLHVDAFFWEELNQH